MRAIAAVSFASMLSVVAACGSVASPAGPVSTGLTSPAGPTAVEPPLAQLRLSRIGLDPTKSGSPLTFVVRFRITESSGISGAVVRSVAIDPGGTTSDHCWGAPLRVGAGENSDAFRELPAVAQCAPTLTAAALAPVVSFDITIAFVDDLGRPGTLAAHIVTDDSETYWIVDHYTSL